MYYMLAYLGYLTRSPHDVRNSSIQCSHASLEIGYPSRVQSNYGNEGHDRSQRIMSIY